MDGLVERLCKENARPWNAKVSLSMKKKKNLYQAALFFWEYVHVFVYTINAFRWRGEMIPREGVVRIVYLYRQSADRQFV